MKLESGHSPGLRHLKAGHIVFGGTLNLTCTDCFIPFLSLRQCVSSCSCPQTSCFALVSALNYVPLIALRMLATA